MIGRRIIINVVTFMLLSAVLITVLIVSIFRVKPRYAVMAEFADSGGVFTGQEVTYRGVTVGRVGELRLTDGGVNIELVIEKDFNRIPEDARARVMFKSAVGEQFVDLLPQSNDPPYLTDGDQIPIGRTDLPVQQETLLRLLARVLDGVPPEAIGNLVDTLGTGLAGRGDDLHRLLGALDPLTAVLARRTSELNSLNTAGDRLGTAFDASADDFVRGTRSAADVAETLGEHSDDLTHLFEAGADALPELGALLSARKTQLDRIIANLAEVTRISYDHLDSVKDTLKWLPMFLAAGVDAYDPDMNRFRFALVNALGNDPCSYGTPRRPVAATGDAEHQPVLNFDCEALPLPISADADAGAGSSEPTGLPARRAEEPRSWVGLLTDVLR